MQKQDNMEQVNIKQLTIDYIKKLTMVKEDFINMKKELAVSIRKDYVKIELKDIINKSSNYEELKNNLNNYINEILEKGNEDYE